MAQAACSRGMADRSPPFLAGLGGFEAGVVPGKEHGKEIGDAAF